MTEKVKSPFVNVSKNLPFWPDQQDIVNGDVKPFIGTFIENTALGEGEEKIPVSIFEEYETGEQKFIVTGYAINKALEYAEKNTDDMYNQVFCFNYVGKSQAKNGRQFTQIDTSFCSLEAYKKYLGV